MTDAPLEVLKKRTSAFLGGAFKQRGRGRNWVPPLEKPVLKSIQVIAPWLSPLRVQQFAQVGEPAHRNCFTTRCSFKKYVQNQGQEKIKTLRQTQLKSIEEI